MKGLTQTEYELLSHCNAPRYPCTASCSSMKSIGDEVGEMAWKDALDRVVSAGYIDKLPCDIETDSHHNFTSTLGKEAIHVYEMVQILITKSLE